MSDQLVVRADMVKIDPLFGPMVVTVSPGPMVTASLPNINATGICVLGDEKLVQLSGTYVKPPFMTPGSGTIKIVSLAPNQPQPGVQIDGKPVLAKGAKFQAMFVPAVPAMNPANGAPDAPAPAMGTGEFIAMEVGVSVG